MDDPPDTRYAHAGDLSIAYQVVGSGPLDLVYVPGLVNHIESTWEEPAAAHHCRRLASFSRLVLFDKRGTGLSDRVTTWDAPMLEQRADDILAVMDAVGSEQAALVATADGVPVAMLFAATHPERVTALVLVGASARILVDDDYPIGLPEEFVDALVSMQERWGDPVAPLGYEILAPSLADDARWRRSLGRMQRLAATPTAALAFWRMNVSLDLRGILPTISAPTLLLHTTGDLLFPVQQARYVADHIPGARLVELPGTDHLYWSENGDAFADEIEEFLTGVRLSHSGERFLATVMFTDIVDSTATAARLGDRRWHDLVDSHDHMVRRQLNRFRGVEVKLTGDGVLATFDGPARAIECACAIRAGAIGLDLQVRAGLHTGEIEASGGDISGLAVNIAARVEALAGPSQVLVSRTVKDLLAGSRIQFQHRGVHSLKGVPDRWEVFEITSA